MACVPVHSAVVLAPRSVFSIEFDSGKDALLATNAAHKLDNANHAAGDVDGVAHVNVLAVCAHSVG